MTALSKIKSAGFELTLIDGSFGIKPASKLNQQQREFLRTHKAELITELKAEQSKAKKTVDDMIVTCYTPNGNPIEVEARDQEHAEFLRRMNPKPEGTRP